MVLSQTDATEAWTVPAGKAEKQNPIPLNEESVARGKTLYERECLSCHGVSGKGDGPAARDLERSPGDLSDPTLRDQTDGELFWKITIGRRPMPGYRKLFTSEERWQVVNYLRTLIAQRGE